MPLPHNDVWSGGLLRKSARLSITLHACPEPGKRTFLARVHPETIEGSALQAGTQKTGGRTVYGIAEGVQIAAGWILAVAQNNVLTTHNT